MHGIIVFTVGAVIGIPLGWTILYFIMAWETRPKRPPTRDEWKVM